MTRDEERATRSHREHSHGDKARSRKSDERSRRRDDGREARRSERTEEEEKDECAVEKKRKDGDGKVAPSIPMNVDWALHQPYLDRLFFKQTDRFPAGSQDHRDAYDFIQRWTQYRSDPAQRSAAAAAVAGRPLCLRPPQAEAGGLRLRAPATRVDTVGGCTCGGGVGTVDT